MTPAERWDALTPAERRALVTRDRTMRAPVFAALVERLANSAYADLTPIQRDGVPEFFKLKRS